MNILSDSQHPQTRTAKPTPVDQPSPAPPPQAAHPYEKIDRATRATLARLTAGVSPHSILATWMDWALHLSRSPGRQMELTERAWRNTQHLTRYAVELATKGEASAPFKPGRHDHRFADECWNKPPFAAWKQSFLAAEDWWNAATAAMPGLAKRDADRARFQVRQALDLISPSNFPWSNPEIIERTLASFGSNLIEGSQHSCADFIQATLQTRQPVPDGYRVGEDLACTPGRVVFRNELLELIQYEPARENVHLEPILFVPAWIMKYYVLDLSPHNSMVKYLVEQGFTVFMISWVNPVAAQANTSFDDYRVKGVMAALDAIGRIMPDRKVHANGYCLGGTLLAIAAATMARDADDRLASVTLMAAQVDFAEAGELLLFVDDSQVAFVEDLMWLQGYLDRPQMTRAFASIRAEDLIYHRAVRRYYLGEEDLPTDLTVWNNDTTRMPARMHSEYLRGLFLENRLSAGRFAVQGQVIALKDIRVPMLVIGTEADHIAPWKSVYKVRLFTDCDLTFILASAGHNGGILSEPGHLRRHFRIGHRRPGSLYEPPDVWLDHQERHAGSWWPEMSAWLTQHSSALGPPPLMGGVTADASTLAPAPGSYVHMT
ncbi:MAG: alpha/beta fold hydrolase [Pseudomonadota bacterium]